MSDRRLETAAEINRRERRGSALIALEHLLNVAIKPFKGDRPSEDDLLSAFKKVSACIEGFEGEANDADRVAQPASSGLQELVEKLPRYGWHQNGMAPNLDRWIDVTPYVKLEDVVAALRAATLNEVE